jgi:hypothetical protein
MKNNEFSESLGLSEPQAETLTQVSRELKTAIWNIIYTLTHSEPVLGSSYPNFVFPDIVDAVANFFDVTRDEIDDISSNQFWQRFKRLFFNLNGIHVYDFINSVAKNITSEKDQQEFMLWLNDVLQEKTSPCRFIAGQLTPITGQAFIDTVNNAASTSSTKVNDDIKKALDCLYRQEFVDACFHAEKALEAHVKNILGKDKGTLGGEAGNLKKMGVPTPVCDAIEKIWGYASDTARHAKTDGFKGHPEQAEAKLVVLHAAVIIQFLDEFLNKP